MKIEITTVLRERKKLEERKSPNRKAFEGFLVVKIYSDPIPEPGTPEDKFINWFYSQLERESYVSAQFSHSFPLGVSLSASTPEKASALVETEKARICTLIEKGLSLYYEKRDLKTRIITITV